MSVTIVGYDMQTDMLDLKQKLSGTERITEVGRWGKCTWLLTKTVEWPISKSYQTHTWLYTDDSLTD